MRHQDHSEDFKDLGSKHNLSKYEYDLYHEEDNIPGRVIQVKKIGNVKKGEKWRILEDSKAILTIDGEKLTSKERNFLYTVEGVTFLMSYFKKGEVSLSSLKRGIKNTLKK
jgi:hypothetical protein